jgi:hypothetical protein
MNLRSRHFQQSDTAACLRLLQKYPEYSPQVFGELPRFWQRLLDDHAIISCVIEDCDAPAGERVMSFGADVFVTDAFMADARSAREPHLSARIIQRELCGHASPILRRTAIARANASDGLNAVIIHAAANDHSNYAIPQRLREAFISSHRGYRLKEMLQEVWNERDYEWVKGWGALRGDYSDFFVSNGTPIPSTRPYLFGITKEEALRDPASVASFVFLSNPPRFQFSEGAQALLMRAMDGETDEVLAKVLYISLPAVRMRWRAIYDRVESIAPELFPERPDVSERVRGKEKRRSIVEYVRAHPEELRPFASLPGRCKV